MGEEMGPFFFNNMQKNGRCKKHETTIGTTVGYTMVTGGWRGRGDETAANKPLTAPGWGTNDSWSWNPDPGTGRRGPDRRIWNVSWLVYELGRGRSSDAEILVTPAGNGKLTTCNEQQGAGEKLVKMRRTEKIHNSKITNLSTNGIIRYRHVRAGNREDPRSREIDCFISIIENNTVAELSRNLIRRLLAVVRTK